MRLTLDDLPESLREVVDLIGLTATLKLVEHFGGAIAVYVPRAIEDDHPLTRAVGLVAARKLSSLYGGDCLRNIPRCARGLRRIRDAEIRRRRSPSGGGESPAQLALAFGLTERQIWTILGEDDDSSSARQAALF